MTGIEILAEYTVGGAPVWTVAVSLVATVVGLILLWCGVGIENENVAIAGIIVLILDLAITVEAELIAEPEHTHYKVAISEDVKLVEFLERYEILDTEGEIYTIREVIPDA
jgi:hypothetical protein